MATLQTPLVSPTDRTPAHQGGGRSGFTLIELLVVVAIIAILGGMLVAAIGVALRQAGLTACTHNLRQVGAAALTFAYDHDGRLPAEGNKGETDPDKSLAWFYRLPPYVDGKTVNDKITVFQCPQFDWQGGSVFDHASPKSYKMNAYLDDDGRPDQCSYNCYLDASSVVLFITAKAGETGVGQWGHCPASAVETRYHGGYANVLFLDLHTCRAEAKDNDEEWREALQWEPADY